MTKDEPMILSTSDEAAKRVTVTGWVARGGQFWCDDERMARWSGATHIPCPECGYPTVKNWTKCEACRQKVADAKWAARERKPYDGGLLYSETYSRYFDNEDDAADFASDEDVTYEDMRLLLCDKEYAHEIDGDDYFVDQLPEDSTLDDAAPDLAEAIAAVNAIIAQRKKDGRQLSWLPSKYAVDVATLPPLEAATTRNAEAGASEKPASVGAHKSSSVGASPRSPVTPTPEAE